MAGIITIAALTAMAGIVYKVMNPKDGAAEKICDAFTGCQLCSEADM